MFLQSQFAAVELSRSDDGTAFEVWWLDDNEMFIVSHSPENYPSTIVHTMTLKEANKELKRLVKEGWMVARYSEEYHVINPTVERYKSF